MIFIFTTLLLILLAKMIQLTDPKAGGSRPVKDQLWNRFSGKMGKNMSNEGIMFTVIV